MSYPASFWCIFYPMLVPSVLWRCWLGGRKGIRPVKTEWWGVGVAIYLSGARCRLAHGKVQTCTWPSWCHCHSLFLALIKSRLVLPFWYWLTRVVLDKGPWKCVCVCVCVRACVRACACARARARVYLFLSHVIAICFDSIEKNKG